jgi:hypothetical protein
VGVKCDTAGTAAFVAPDVEAIVELVKELDVDRRAFVQADSELGGRAPKSDAVDADDVDLDRRTGREGMWSWKCLWVPGGLCLEDGCGCCNGGT